MVARERGPTTTCSHDVECEANHLMDMKLDVVVLPVSDVETSKEFYRALGWQVDVDVATEDLRVVRMVPPGSRCAVLFGRGITTARPGSVRGLVLSVTDIEAARAELSARGAAVGEIYHDSSGVFRHSAPSHHVPGLDPRRRSEASFAAFDDPDGNGWLLQEATTPGRWRSGTTG